jgi:hypothetical protein
MAKTLRTKEDYTIKTGDGSGGSNSIILDTKTTRVKGDLVVDGTNTVVNSTTLTIDDPQIVLARNNSGTDVDAGIIINRSGQTGYQADNNVAMYWNEGDNVFKLVATTSDGTGTTITDTALANIRVAEPSNNSDAATKNYVDSVAGVFAINFTGDDSTTVEVTSGNTVDIAGGSNISTAAKEPDTITVNLNNNLTDIHSITNSSTNADLTLSANSNGSVVINDVLTFNANRSGEPTATAVTKMFAQTPSGGGTGVFFVNSAVSSGAVGELISKKKATALAIALG